MKVLGITAEYNPFHKGHKYHLERAKALSGADVTVVAMSGDFTQRGEPAIFDKWVRSRSAVIGGADAVFELPFVFACNRAPVFAAGGVDSLVKAGATHISFGCETEEPDDLIDAADRIMAYGDDIEELTSSKMKDGLSRARAYQQAVGEILGEGPAGLISKPNNILAVEYLKRISMWRKRGFHIEAVPVVRTGSGYNDADPDEGFAGASAIREMAADPSCGREEIGRFIPADILDLLFPDEAFVLFREQLGAAADRYFQIVRSILIRSASDELARIYCVGEGIENRMKNSILKAGDIEGFTGSIVSRRYTAAAVKRMTAYIALGLNGADADRMIGSAAFDMPYLRLLAAGSGGRELLRELKKAEVCTITNVNRQIPENDDGRDMLSTDIKAADLYNALMDRRLYACSDKVFTPYIES